MFAGFDIKQFAKRTTFERYEKLLIYIFVGNQHEAPSNPKLDLIPGKERNDSKNYQKRDPHQCDICFKEFVSEKDLIEQINCAHKEKICRNCFNSYVENHLSNRGTNIRYGIPCPIRYCNKTLDRHSIKRNTKPQTFEIYESLMVAIYVGLRCNLIS